MNHTLVNQFAPAVDARRRVAAWIERLARVARTIETWKQRQRSRRQLAEVDIRILRDIGISEAQRAIECNKPYWEE